MLTRDGRGLRPHRSHSPYITQFDLIVITNHHIACTHEATDKIYLQHTCGITWLLLLYWPGMGTRGYIACKSWSRMIRIKSTRWSDAKQRGTNSVRVTRHWKNI